MQAFKTFTGIMAYLPMANVDTDMIIPKHYLKTIKRTGLGAYLFSELRFDEHNQPRSEFILNQPELHNTSILVTEENFGCGSSREHAVWSLWDYGIRVVIAPGFADIFYSNCFKNGLLAIVLPPEQIQQLVKSPNNVIVVDLEGQIIKSQCVEISFSIDAYRRESLLKGLDEIGDTLTLEQQIITFEVNQKMNQPWLYCGDKNHA